MKVFISWSGPLSNGLAEVLRSWLPGVIQAVRPYYSPADLDKGTRWASEIAAVLEEAKLGLICVTRENLEAPWVMFEAGALSKNLGKAKVTPLLFGVEPADLTGPLVQFQAARFERQDIRRVIGSINNELGDNKLSTDVLNSVFEMWWPRLEEAVAETLAHHGDITAGPQRSQRDLLEEILMLTRAQGRRAGMGEVHPRAVEDLTAGLEELLGCEALESPEAMAALERLYRATSHIRLHMSRLGSRGRRDAKEPETEWGRRMRERLDRMGSAFLDQEELPM